MNLTLEIYIVFTALLASLAAYFMPGTPRYLKHFTPFLAIDLVVEIVGAYLVQHHRQNAVLYNVFSIFNFCFYFFVLRQIIRNENVKRMMFWVLIVFPLLATANLLFIQGIYSFNSMTFSLGSIGIVGLCIYYFYELFRLPEAVNLLREPAFWICSGLIFFFVCSFPLLGLTGFLSHASASIIFTLEMVMIIVNFFLYLLLTIAFLCRIPIRKSM